MARSSTTFKKGNNANPKGRPKGVPNKATLEIKEWGREVLESEEYRASVTKRIMRGEAPHMETLLHHYAYGKPVDRIAPTDPTGTKEYGAGGLTEEERAARIVAFLERARTRSAESSSE